MNDNTTTRGSGDESDRGQAAIIGLVLLIGLVAIGSLGILLVGAGANEESKKQINNDKAQKSFVKLNEQIDGVSRTKEGTEEFDLDLPTRTDTALQVDGVGRIWVNKTNFGTGPSETVVEQEIGEIRKTTYIIYAKHPLLYL